MAEDRAENEIIASPQPAGDPDEQEAEEEILLPPEVLEAIHPEERARVTRAFASLTRTSVSGPAFNPVLSQIKPEHITQLITNTESQGNREAEAEKSNRRYQFLYFILALAALLFLLVFFTIREQYDLLTAVVTGAMGFGGGFGIGRLTGGR